MAAGHTQYRIRATDETSLFLKRLHPQIKRKVKSALKLIVADPGIGKSLRDGLQGLKSFRVGRFRIIYHVAPAHSIELVAIGPRKTIYEETYRLIKKETR
jgi:mRNA interferase RelE/StbE